MKHQKTLTLKTLTKSNVWELQENDIFRMWEAAEKDADLKDNLNHYIDVIRSAFEIEEVKIDKPVVISKYEARGFKIGTLRTDDNDKKKWAIKKRPITRVTDLTYDISTTTLPKDRLHKPGGMYDKKVKDGYEVLEIAKGNWIEAIFAKTKPEMEKPTAKDDDLNEFKLSNDDDEEDDDEDLPEDLRNDDDDDNDDFDEEKLTEESYRTTFDTDPEDLNLEAEDISDEDDNY